MGKLLLAAAALAVMVTLVTTAATGAKQKHGTAKAGGVYRVGWVRSKTIVESFGVWMPVIVFAAPLLKASKPLITL